MNSCGTDYTSFPFRLRDKIERLHSRNYKQDYYYNLHGEKIVKTYRKKALRIFGENAFSKENNFGAVLPVKKVRITSDAPGP